MINTEKLWLRIAGLNGFIAIVMGAIAAHGVSDVHAASMADKASLYQLIHSVVLLWLASVEGKCFMLARLLIISGIILFCGSIYLKALSGWENATAVAPLGGVSFMIAWLVIAFAYRGK